MVTGVITDKIVFLRKGASLFFIKINGQKLERFLKRNGELSYQYGKQLVSKLVFGNLVEIKDKDKLKHIYLTSKGKLVKKELIELIISLKYNSLLRKLEK